MKKTFIIALHIGYWILYLLLLLLFALFIEAGQRRAGAFNFIHVTYFMNIMGVIAILPGVINFYTFYHYLFNRFLATKKIVLLCIAGIIASLLAGLVGVAGWLLISKGFFLYHNQWQELFIALLFIVLLALIHGVIALVMKGFVNWYDDIRIKQELKQKNIETELALIKSRLSPHFLFNTINNIDVLIQKDPASASEYLNKLSDIMRFMLYESKAEYIPLEKELEYIEKYIALQKIRVRNENFISYIVQGDYNHRSIASMLFMPFIENAFKHTVAKSALAINIKISIQPASISFTCENRCRENAMAAQEAGGLGNELIQKRINLLYPARHQLHIAEQDGFYKVNLIIYDAADNMHSSGR